MDKGDGGTEADRQQVTEPQPSPWPEYRFRFPRYNRWLANRLRPFMGQRVLEVQCGLGHMTGLLLDREFLVAVDSVAEHVAAVQARYGEREDFGAAVQDMCSPDALSLRQYGIDTILCANLLEHLDDDRALDTMVAILPPGGRLITLVAAFESLFNALDRGAGHLRRYDKGAFVAQLARHELSVNEAFYVNSLGLLGWWVRGSLLRREMPSVSQLRLFDRLVPLWGAVERRIPPPFGLSLVCVADKRRAGIGG